MKPSNNSAASLMTANNRHIFQVSAVFNRQAWFVFALWLFVCVNHACWGQVAGKLHFSDQPTSAEISSARIFDEPLTPMGGEPVLEENRALAEALTAYASRSNFDDFASMTGFLDRFPDSKWSGSLLLHLGTEYYNSGYYSRALSAWEQAWHQCKNINAGPGKAQADLALAELARMYSKLGRMTELNELLESSKDRALGGPGAQLVLAAKDALQMMQNHPEFCFRCGPMALDKIRSHEDAAKGANILILNSKSTTNGFSLFQVADLSRQLGMDYQMAFRSNGAAFIIPAVVHWKLGHYAALLQQDGDRYLIQDNTFVSSAWMTTAALSHESSGYFLVPPGPLPDGLHIVAATDHCKRTGENKMLAGPAALRDPVGKQFHRVAIRINFGRDKIRQPVGEGVAGDINHRIRRPVGLVKIKSVLANEPVISHQALVVASRRVTLVAAVGGEVEHVPKKFAPEIRARFHQRPVGFVNEILPFLRMISAAGGRPRDGVFAVLINARARAVFADADAVRRMRGVNGVRPRGDAVERAGIPAEILVERDELRIPRIRVAVAAAKHGGGGRARRVFLRFQLDKLINKIGRGGADAERQFVIHSPPDDGGMIISLPDQFAKLLLGVVVKVRRLGDSID